MASESDVLDKISEDCLECGICKQRYTSPKILDCAHTFCENCLVSHFGNDQVKPCPVCRQETYLPVPGGVSGLKTNGFIMTLRDRIKLQETVAEILDKTKELCELCNENADTHHCLNCSQNICQSCMKIHLRIKGMADHTVITLEDIRDGKFSLPEVQKEYTCIKHEGEINRFYCKTCHVLICRDCTGVDHCKPEHQYIDRASASSKYKKVLNEIVLASTNVLENFRRRLEDTSKAQQSFKNNVLLTTEQVQRAADLRRAMVTAEEKRIVEEIRAVTEDRNKTFDKNIKLMKSLLQRKQHALAIATDVTNKGSESDFLSLFQLTKQDLTSLSNSVLPQIDAKFQCLRFDQTRITPDGSIKMGELDLGDTKWELRQEVGEDWAELKVESLSGITALRGDKLAVTTTGGRLVILNTDGGFEKTIKTKGRPCCVASVHYGPVVVSGSRYFEIYKEDFTLAMSFPLRTLPKGDHHTCICTKKDGTILVGNSSKNVIISLDRPDDPQKHTTTSISLQKTPRFLATDSNDRVVVSYCNDNQVTVIDNQGVTLVAIKPTIDGQPVGYCSGVCCDGSDTFYVAVSNLDSGSGHIHRYDGDGKFLSCVVQGLYHPMGIAFTEDRHLAVVDDNRVKIYHICKIILP